MSIFKRAYVRGVNDELVRLGHLRWPSKTAADAIADAVGDQMPVEPAAEGVSPETAADVAATLIDSANKLVEESGGMPEAAAPEEEALKTSAAQDLATRAGQQAYAIMVKAAEETKQAVGSTIEGGDKGNKMTDTPAAETEMEAKNRPEMIHVVGEGNTQSGAGRGTGVVGKEDVGADTPDGAPNETPSGSNSALEQSKMGTLREIIQKVAMGSTIEGGDKGNKGTDATAAETIQEFQRRPEGYAENMLAQSDLPVTPAATVGTEQAQPIQPGESPAGSTPGEAGNSNVQWSNESKTGAAEDPFIALFRKTAEMVGGSLPTSLDEEQKIAHLRQMMGMTDAERAEYIGLLHKEAGSTDDEAVNAAKTAACKMRDHRSRYSGNPGRKDRRSSNQKTAAELPAALKEQAEKMKNKAEKKDNGEKKDEKEDNGEKKEMAGEEMPAALKEGSDLLSRIRRVSQQGASA
jgi:hypothetical protein